jgi:cholesterol transport system auxiliary component
MNTIKFIAAPAYSTPENGLNAIKNRLRKGASSRFVLLALSLAITACSTPQPPVLKTVYDFGPVLQAQSQSISLSTTQRAAIALPEIEASGSLSTPALLYRLQYTNAQELRPYAQARWSTAPAQLVRERIRDVLAIQGPVLPTEGQAPYTLRIELDEFSQLFETPEKSTGLLRLRGSLFKGSQLIAQSAFQTKANAPSADAAGGVKALTAATDDVARQLSSWLAMQIK